MKVLIVDDEQHVREGIRLLGEWKENDISQVLEAESGEQAIELIQVYKPEIIFTDMKMPEVDGIALLEWIKNHHDTSKSIVVTGYDDYHYMRKAIHFGSTDYILKPIDPAILNDTLKRAVQDWKKEEQNRQKHTNSHQLMNEMKPIYRDRKLTQLMNNHLINGSIYQEFGFHFSQQYQVAIVRVDQKIIDAFQGDRDLVYFSILNIVNEMLHEEKCGIAFRYLSNKGEIVMIFWNRFDHVQHMLETMHSCIRKTLEVCCFVAIGPVVKSIENLMLSYNGAKDVLLHTNVLDQREGKVYAENHIEKLEIINVIDYLPQIKEAVQLGQFELFEDILTAIMQQFQVTRYLSLKQLLHLEKEYQLMSQQWMKKYDVSHSVSPYGEDVVYFFFDDNGDFDLQNYMNRKRREVHFFVKIVKRHTKKKNQDVIYDIEQFLQANFDRDVKLQEISDRFYLSREYISRKFKQKFNENISDYLVKVRMNKAKQLLRNEELKVYEVANMIGYQDDKYFRKVFKKMEGVTPNEYRTSIRVSTT
ncbi:response regulator [Bacillus sp. CGMCC 1.16541]|uniref:response regulator transcription factor n=1 Tax=Bacillus sp. CGMCC 1.16541 TaxID=2185143 RepID=UPI000D7335A1|nr:response regulator [Bacillus sp. CGMCC 1.16541]